MDFGFLTEQVAFPVWGFGFVALAVFTAVFASNRLNKANREVE